MTMIRFVHARALPRGLHPGDAARRIADADRQPTRNSASAASSMTRPTTRRTS
jgi:hypothetical protein